MKEFLNKLIELSLIPSWTEKRYDELLKRETDCYVSYLNKFLFDLSSELSLKYNNNLVNTMIYNCAGHHINQDFIKHNIFYKVSDSVANILKSSVKTNKDKDFLNIMRKKTKNHDFESFILFKDSLIKSVFYSSPLRKDEGGFYITEYKIKDDKPYINICYFVYYKESLPIFGQIVSNENGFFYMYDEFEWYLENAEKFKLSPKLHKEVKEHFNLFKNFFLFLEYAPIENKESFIAIDKHSKVKLPKSKNKIKVPLLNIDSTYYTNFRLNSKFNVNGHFRLQPYGKERQLKKIIWINEFKKSGYVRQAKILTSV